MWVRPAGYGRHHAVCSANSGLRWLRVRARWPVEQQHIRRTDLRDAMRALAPFHEAIGQPSRNVDQPPPRQVARNELGEAVANDHGVSVGLVLVAIGRIGGDAEASPGAARRFACETNIGIAANTADQLDVRPRTTCGPSPLIGETTGVLQRGWLRGLQHTSLPHRVVGWATHQAQSVARRARGVEIITEHHHAAAIAGRALVIDERVLSS